MFQTFTGSSRRPRQVNLSGRNANPFSNVGGQQATSNTVINAQQSRLQRQHERTRVQAATNVQRVWRGYRTRRVIKQEQRQQWEQVEASLTQPASTLPTSYPTAAHAHEQLVRLLRFVNIQEQADREKVTQICERIVRGCEQERNNYNDGPWPSAYLRLQNTVLLGLTRATKNDSTDPFLNILQFTANMIPELTTMNAQAWYVGLRSIIRTTQVPVDLAAAPLQSLGGATQSAYLALAQYMLTLPRLGERLKCGPASQSPLKDLSQSLNCKLLASSLRRSLEETGNIAAIVARRAPKEAVQQSYDNFGHDCAWLAAYIVYFYQQVLGVDHPERYMADEDLISILCALLGNVANGAMEGAWGGTGDLESTSLLARSNLDPFVIEQLSALVNQKSINSLVSRMSVNSSSDEGSSLDSVAHNAASKTLATYILTLVRLFPNRADEIRMWLYIGSSSSYGASSSARSSSAINFFWQASYNTIVFRKIYDDPRAVVDLLKPQASPASTRHRSKTHAREETLSIDNEWQIIFLFIEMYSFVLKIMDDETFFTFGGETGSEEGAPDRNNNLQRDEVRSLSTFLKHLGFTMYYNAADILGTIEDQSEHDINSLFSTTANREAHTAHSDHTGSSTIVGGGGLDYIKGAVTGLLRAIYERDSRRQFLPNGHWLMTARFDMANFVNHVVDEEWHRHQVRRAEQDAGDDESDDDMDDIQSPTLVGAGHARRIQKSSDREARMRKLSRKRHLQRVAPRLEILQNMPFLIPFTLRVQIFRQFVFHDQRERRNGIVDSESWRLAQMHGLNNNVERHHAKVRRDHEFDDAFQQFYGLGSDLKEPIHITFLDRFGQEEAGIDGGGVTKEFLTSVTNQAFSDQEGVRLFVENDKHLLFPNPSAVEEARELLREMGLKDDSPEFRSGISDMLQRYEFLGRIIGKSLYEGILVDVSFAAFFLLKWALTGGAGSAPKESGYRANINDLREFDEELYQGLLKLKNYSGNVEDFALNFTVADTLSIPSRKGQREKITTRELRPGGSDIPVTNANRLVYISYMTRHRLTTQPYQQTNAFLKGLGSMISPSWLSMFNQQELQTLVGGAASAINVADLRANTSYGGVYVIGDDGQEHPSVQLFWKVMETFPDEDRRKVLKFVTSTPRAPLLGFGSLMPRFSIRDSGGDDTRLPSTSTCVNLLKLPRYKTFDGCRTKLLQAVNSGAGFDLS